MKMRFLMSVAYADGKVFHRGDVGEVDDDAEAGRLVAAGIAVPDEDATAKAVPAAKRRKTAVAPPDGEVR